MDPTLAALLGAAVGAAATIAIGFVTRVWASQDARSAARQRFVVAVSDRFQQIIKADSLQELERLNHEMFGSAALGIYIPRHEDAVFIWYSLRDVEVMNAAKDKWANGGAGQANVFNLSIDAISELRAWARHERHRHARWFQHQLDTTDRPLIEAVNATTARQAAVLDGTKKS